MKTRTTLFAAAAVVAALAGASALAHSGYGPGYGPGAGCGYGAGPGAGPGMGPGMMGYGMGPGMGPGAGRGMGPGMAPGMGGRDPAAVARQLEETKAALKIGADQEAAWKAYAEVQTRQVEARANFHEKMAAQWADPKATLPDREAMRETMYKFRQEMQAQRVAALRSLYAALTPEQKAVAEQQLFGWGGRHPMGGRGYGRW